MMGKKLNRMVTRCGLPLLLSLGLQGCYVLNMDHYNDVAAIDANIARLKAADEKLAAEIAALKPFEQALEREFATEIRQQTASIEHPSSRSVGMAMQNPLLFASGSADISKSGRSVLSRLAKALKTAPESTIIRVVGHTDPVPLNKARQSGHIDNWDLSAARAASVTRALVWGKNIDEKRIRIEGRAYHDPVASNRTAAGMAKNRRVEVFVELAEQ